MNFSELSGIKQWGLTLGAAVLLTVALYFTYFKSQRNNNISAQAALAGAERLTDDDPLTAGLLELHAERLGRVNRERTLRRRFAAAHPQVATATVAALATDVHDLDSLRRIATSMSA